MTPASTMSFFFSAVFFIAAPPEPQLAFDITSAAAKKRSKTMPHERGFSDIGETRRKKKRKSLKGATADKSSRLDLGMVAKGSNGCVCLNSEVTVLVVGDNEKGNGKRWGRKRPTVVLKKVKH